MNWRLPVDNHTIVVDHAANARQSGMIGAPVNVSRVCCCVELALR